jgi:Universal stress protein UspA and related nucleotide-binding proteins
MYTKIALAIAFSPRIEALIAEVKRLVLLFDTELLLIHVGTKTPQLEEKLDQLLQRHGCDKLRIKVLWLEGKPVKMILKACEEEKVDLLVAGALKQEGLFKYYMGTVGRKIIRKAPCSVLTLIEPKVETSEFSRIVINGTQLEFTPQVIEQGLEFSKIVKADLVSILNEIKLYGLQMGTAGEDSEDEISQTRKRLVQNEIEYVEKIIDKLDKGNLKINVKVTGGKWAVELARFCEKDRCQLARGR